MKWRECLDFKMKIEEILKKTVKERTQKEHLFLIKENYKGSVRDYLLSMGEFKKDSEEEAMKILKDYAILDPCNVCGVFPFIKRNEGEIKELETDMGFFKKVEKPKIIMSLSTNFEGYVIEINNTKYSKDYIDGMIKMASVWFSEVPDVFMMYDKEKEEFKKDSPIMFIFGDKLCFILAPRVETEDEE